MSAVDGRIHLVITDAVRERIAAADRRSEWTVQDLADASCKAFCGPRGLTRGLNGVQLDIHRRQHIEVATAIFDAKGA